jgi:uncharacterized protein (TIGR02246 family)
MNMKRMLLAFVGLLIALPATAWAQDDAKAQIEAVSAKWQAAYNSGDGAAVAALYTEDGALMPPNAEPVMGTKAIQAFWDEGMASGVTFELKTKEVYEAGDMLVEVGGYVGTAADGSHADHGKFVVVYKKVDGEWKLHRDIWNSSMP